MKILMTLILTTLSLWSEQIPISTSTRATPIGTFKFGDVVSIQYVKGEWARRVQNPKESPDSTSWKELRIVVYWEDAMGNRVVTAQPFRTAKDAHKMKVDREGRYFIRMAEPRSEGVGVVFYEITTMEKEEKKVEVKK